MIVETMEKSTSSIALTLSRPPLPSRGNVGHGKEVLTSENQHKSTTNEQRLQIPQGRATDPNMDPKKLRRVIASRQYSQKYRMKQMHYIMQLEAELKVLQAEVAITGPRIKYADRQNTLLRVENGSMKQKLSAFAGELMFKEAQYDELKKEKDVLKQLFMANFPMLMPERFGATNTSVNYQFINLNTDHPGFNP